MKVLVILTLTAAALAAPDVSLGYRYQIPTTSYGTPISPSDSSLVNPNRQYYHVGSIGSVPVTPTPPVTVFQTPIREYSSFTGGGISSGAGFGLPGSLTGRINSPVATFTSSSGISSSGQTGFSSADSRGTFQQQQGEVQRHLYFFAAPEEQEVVRPRVTYPSVTSQKNVKIIFIKAPTYSASGPIQIPAQPQNEEKTLVYVLVKKADEEAQIEIQTPAPVKPSKPEVYFIKYKTQQDAQQAISNVQNGLVATGVNANAVEGDQDFINSISQSPTFDERSGSVIAGGNTASRGGFGGGFTSVSSLGSSTTATPTGDFISVSSGGSSTASPIGDSFISVSSVGSSTASPKEQVNVGSGITTGSGIHQLYGPPK